MSKSYRGAKGDGFEFWKSRLDKYGMYEEPTPKIKKWTHKKERRQNKENLRDYRDTSDDS